MKTTVSRLIVLVVAASLASIFVPRRGTAQQTPSPVKECNPCIGSPLYNYTSADYAREVQKREQYCKAHPEKCGPADFTLSQENLRAIEKASEERSREDPSYYKKVELGHTTTCCHDPNAPPDKYVCIPDTWTGGPMPDYGHCYSNPGNHSEVRCMPRTCGD